MKLGEALSLRASQATRLAELRQRLTANATSQEGQSPAEDPEKLLEDYEFLSAEHRNLVTRIAHTNVSTNMIQKLQDREDYRRRKNTLEILAVTAERGRAMPRYGRSEIVTVSNVDTAAIRARIDKLTEDIRVLDAQIQAANWETELE